MSDNKQAEKRASLESKQPKPAPKVDKTVVYVSNLPYEVSDVFVSDAFWEGAQLEPHHVEVLKMGMPHGHKKTCGLAVVKMKTEEEAKLALVKMDGYSVLGRPMIVRADKFVDDDPNYYHGKEEDEAKKATGPSGRPLMQV